MILSDVKIRVKRQFGDEAAVQVTDADIVRWVNDAQRDCVMKNETVLQTSSTTSAVANQQDYTLPTNLQILRTIRFKRTGDLSYYKLEGMSMSEFDEYVDGWDGTAYGASVPVVYTVYPSGTLKIFPVPAEASTNGIKIVYSRQPVDVVNDADSIDLPLSYHNAVVAYCLARAYELDEDWSAANNMGAEYDAGIKLNKDRENWTNREVYPRITVLDEDMY